MVWLWSSRLVDEGKDEEQDSYILMFAPNKRRYNIPQFRPISSTCTTHYLDPPSSYHHYIKEIEKMDMMLGR